MAIIDSELAKMEMQILQRFPSPSCFRIDRPVSLAGLGTSTAKEAKEYFSNMERHRIIFRYDSIKDDLAIQLAFNSALSDDRKDWIKWHTEDLNQRREQNLPADYLYRKDTKQINFNDFINKELVLFSKSSTERAIPSIMVRMTLSSISRLTLGVSPSGRSQTGSTENHVRLFHEESHSRNQSGATGGQSGGELCLSSR